MNTSRSRRIQPQFCLVLESEREQFKSLKINRCSPFLKSMTYFFKILYMSIKIFILHSTKLRKKWHQIRKMIIWSLGGTMHDSTLILNGCIWSLIDQYKWKFSSLGPCWLCWFSLWGSIIFVAMIQHLSRWISSFQPSLRISFSLEDTRVHLQNNTTKEKKQNKPKRTKKKNKKENGI